MPAPAHFASNDDATTEMASSRPSSAWLPTPDGEHLLDRLQRRDDHDRSESVYGKRRRRRGRRRGHPARYAPTPSIMCERHATIQRIRYPGPSGPATAESCSSAMAQESNSKDEGNAAKPASTRPASACSWAAPPHRGSHPAGRSDRPSNPYVFAGYDRDATEKRSTRLQQAAWVTEHLLIFPIRQKRNKDERQIYAPVRAPGVCAPVTPCGCLTMRMYKASGNDDGWSQDSHTHSSQGKPQGDGRTAHSSERGADQCGVASSQGICDKTVGRRSMLA